MFQISGFECKLKNTVFLLNFDSISLIFLPFYNFCVKHMEKTYSDQHLECALPKRWSKYTTFIFFSSCFCHKPQLIYFCYLVLVFTFISLFLGRSLSLFLSFSLSLFLFIYLFLCFSSPLFFYFHLSFWLCLVLHSLLVSLTLSSNYFLFYLVGLFPFIVQIFSLPHTLFLSTLIYSQNF